jgi:DUF4097 and DUF4098 domain-containing protein YvlB
MRLNVSTRSGRVHVVARDGATLRVDGAQVEYEPDGTVQIGARHGGSNRVEVVCPTGTDVIVGNMSGRVELHGHFGVVRVTTRSGRVEIGHAAEVDVRSSSGAVDIAHCSGPCRVVTTSSHIRIGHAGRLDGSSTSGRIEVGSVEDAALRTMSGRVEVGTRDRGRVDVRTLSGRVEVAVPRDRRPATNLRSVSGRVRCDCEQGHDGEVHVATTSGAIRVSCR